MSDNDYYSKYLKYKMKYQHQKMQVGGDKEIKILIKGMPPQNYELDYKDNYFFRDIQNFVLREKSIPIDKQIIFYTKKNKKLTEDDLLRSLADLDFDSGDRTPHFLVSSPPHVIVRMPGTCDKNFIEIADDETFGTLKDKISRIKGVLVWKIEMYSPKYNSAAGIIQNTHKVDDNKLLRDYNIFNGTIIDYVILP
jgi:hypothetical protein